MSKNCTFAAPLLNRIVPEGEAMNKVDGYLKQFVIQFSGLKFGRHEYSFEIGKLFFDRFQIDDVSGGDVWLDFSLVKRENMLKLEFNYNGTLRSKCDRCLGFLDIIIDGVNELHVKFGHKHSEEDDELLVLDPEEYKIDIAPLLYEFIALQMPLRKVHDEHECNPEVIARLEGIAENETEETPSIWDKLKELK